MNLAFYSNLAFSGIRKNKKLYIPFAITSSVMVFMFFILTSLSNSDILESFSGGDNLKLFLSLGKWVVGVFSLIFLFYTNSFLMKRRNKEFGLFNVLGMDKKAITKIIIVETFFLYVVSIFCGLILGLAFNKFAELGLCKLLNSKTDLKFRLSFSSFWSTALLFFGVYLLIFVSSFIKLLKTKAIDLLHSENLGEKAPKSNFILSIVGLIILAVAYYFAIAIKSPLSALLMFFVAVIMVIVATYILFACGSVSLCKALQKNKKYYYNKKHFISVSSMTYRMKRNGIGLASICVLCTMVLVILSSIFSLYIGAEDSLSYRYPNDINISVNFKSASDINDENVTSLKNYIDEFLEDENKTKSDIKEYQDISLYGVLNEKFETSSTIVNGLNTFSYDKLLNITIIPISLYNASLNENITLKNNEAVIQTNGIEYLKDTIQIEDCPTLNVKSIVSGYEQRNTISGISSILVFVNDLSTFASGLNQTENENIVFEWLYLFDIEDEDDKEIEFANKLNNFLLEKSESDKFDSLKVDSKAHHRIDFFTTFGGLFFIGVILCIVFIFATVLIIYYKQIVEGFEDKSRFEIMQKIGMTKQDIKNNINSQILTVFFAPIILAGIHLVFAFPFMWKLLQLFSLYNKTLIIIVTICSFTLFAIFYAIVYKVTSNTYYKIVSDKKT